METQDTNYENRIYPQEAINEGQARINYELNEVDKDVVLALNEIVQILKTIKALPQLTHDLRTLDFTKVDQAITDAGKRSDEVADIRPPGCTAPPYPPTGD